MVDNCLVYPKSVYIQTKALATLQFLFVGTNELSTSSGNGWLARLLDLALEYNDVSFLPHLGDQSLSWDHHTCEADLDALELAKCLEHCLTCDTERAKSCDDH